jgi:hypothetical protein
MNFGDALIHLKNGERTTRPGWNGKNAWIALQHPTHLSKMTRPYLFMSTSDGYMVPWLASQTDLLAEDWECLR